MKIFGKRIGELLNLVIGGKPKTIKPSSKEEMKNLINLVEKTNEGNEEAFKELNEKIFPPKETLIEGNTELLNIQKNISTTESKLKTASDSRETYQVIEQLENNSDFEVKKENGNIQYFLKGFKAELPFNLVEKFANLIATGKNYSHLLSFWMMNLLNDNADARRGLYKYLTKQKLIITPQGYLLTFRRLIRVTKKVSENMVNFSDTEIDVIHAFQDKIKRWKKNTRNFEVYQNNNDKGNFILTKIEKHEQNQKNYNLKFKGVLYDCVERIKTQGDQLDNKEVFTDGYTKTMVIHLNEPVRMSRAKCNSNPNVECSYGLHVGTPSYVRGGGHGDTIVACLVNPMHVISVPYSDAHKMRVCEYLPFMVLTPSELNDFDKIDISLYEKQYKEIEKSKLLKTLEVIDNLSPAEKTAFTGHIKPASQDSVNKIQNELDTQKENLEQTKKTVLTLLDDDVSKALDMDEVRRILKARLKN